MKETHFDSWAAFVESLRAFTVLPYARKRQLIFRGQGNATWSLIPTIDRLRVFRSSESRNRLCERLLTQFRTAASGLGISFDSLDALQFEGLARHHGVPTAILDWTFSPYIAAFFAFDSTPGDAERVAIWIFDRAVFEAFGDAMNDIVIPMEDSTYALRAIEQQGIVMRLRSSSSHVESLMESGLEKITLPSSERRTALMDLESMGITTRSLFRDLDGAARTVARRVLEFGEVTDD